MIPAAIYSCTVMQAIIFGCGYIFAAGTAWLSFDCKMTVSPETQYYAGQRDLRHNQHGNCYTVYRLKRAKIRIWAEFLHRESWPQLCLIQILTYINYNTNLLSATPLLELQASREPLSYKRGKIFGAGDGIRTRDPKLGKGIHRAFRYFLRQTNTNYKRKKSLYFLWERVLNPHCGI